MQDLDGDGSAQLDVLTMVDDAEAAGGDALLNTIAADRGWKVAG